VTAFLRHRHQRTGVILLIMLAMIALLSILTISFLNRVSARMEELNTLRPPESMRDQAYSLLAIAIAGIAEINELESEFHSTAQAWGDPIAYAAIELPPELHYTLTIRDESGKLPLNITDKPLLNAFFETLEIPEIAADALSDAWLDWMDADEDVRINGAESISYQENGYKSANAPPQSFQELRLIQGFDEWFMDASGVPNERYQMLTETFSLFHTGPVNMNSIHPSLKTILQHAYGLRADALEVSTFSTRDPWLTDQDLKTAFNGTLPQEIKVSSIATTLHLSLDVKRGTQVFRIECILKKNNTSAPTKGNASSKSAFQLHTICENRSFQ